VGDRYTHWFTENITLSKNGNFYPRLTLMNSAICKIVVMEHSSKCTILVSTILSVSLACKDSVRNISLQN